MGGKKTEPEAGKESVPAASSSYKAVALPWKVRAIIALGGLLIRALGKTWRIRVLNPQVSSSGKALEEATIYLLWHGQMLPILYAHRGRTGILISEHRDGELIAGVAEQFNHFGVRGSTSRGGARALLEAVRVIRSGTHTAFTPDGPRGPRYSFAPGPLILAHRTGAPLVTITASVDRLWRLKSWDGLEIPKPFARVTVRYSSPRKIEDEDARAAAARSEEFRALMLDDLERTIQEAGQPK